jgi:hypothetical protein
VSDLGLLVHNECRYDVIQETQNSKEKNFTSEHIIDANDALDTGHEYLGPGYRQLGKPDSGVFRSADNLRRFRIDNGSIQGTHEPNVPHVHLERLDPVNPKRVLSNNHVPIINY